MNGVEAVRSIEENSIDFEKSNEGVNDDLLLRIECFDITNHTVYAYVLYNNLGGRASAKTPDNDNEPTDERRRRNVT